MALKNPYLCDLMNRVEQRNAGHTQFLITVRSVLESIEPVVEAHPEYVEKAVSYTHLMMPSLSLAIVNSSSIFSACAGISMVSV